ncbi:MAG: DUF2194 domain-containing protein [Pseudomonadota bacterium]
MPMSRAVVLVFQPSDTKSRAVFQNARASLKDASIPYLGYELDTVHRGPNLDDFACVVICAQITEKLSDSFSEDVSKYVSRGGGVVFACGGFKQSLSEVIGISDPGQAGTLVESRGLRFVGDLFPGTEGLSLGSDTWDILQSRVSVSSESLLSACSIQIEDLAGCPVLWLRNSSVGRVTFWNTDILSEKLFRGFLFQTILATMDVAVATIGGFATVQIDDFPPSESYEKPIHMTDEFPDMFEEDFFFGPWINDMLALRNRFDLRFTYFLTLDYSDFDTSKEAKVPDTTKQSLQYRLGRFGELPSGDEYGFHGFNHVEHTRKGWPHENSFKRKVSAARHLWRQIVGERLPTAWVPPNNSFDERTVRLLKRHFPEISIVCSLHSTGAFSNGCNREFGGEPWCHELLNIPRQTYGFILTEAQRALLLSQILGMGVWTHFMHPDDVTDIRVGTTNLMDFRNPENLNWKTKNEADRDGMFVEFERWIGWVTDIFPWLEFVTISDAAGRWQRLSANGPSVEVFPDRVEVATQSDQLLFIRLAEGRKLSNRKQGAVLAEYKVSGGTLYVVSCSKRKTCFHLIERRRNISD